MHSLLQVDFPHAGPWGDEMTMAMAELARSIAVEPGLVWKVWTENAARGEAGGIYCFESEAQAQRYLDKHSERLKAMGVTEIHAKLFAINTPLSRLTHAMPESNAR